MYFYDSLNEIKHFLAFNFQGFREKMKYKKTIILLALVVFLLSIAGVSASEIDNTIASENANTIELSTDNDIEGNLQTSEENEALASTDYDEAIAQTDTEVLGADSAKYSDLANEIRQPGNIKLTHKNYTYTGGETITIGEANKVIDGNGAVIDMAGSTIRAFNISASGVTIKNLTIKNANYKGNGGAIYFNSTGTVTNCNFTGNTANYGALYFLNQGTVTNCNFTGNTANFDGGVIKMGSGTVSNCNFVDNKANEDGGAVYFKSNGEVTNCNFTGNTATRFGGAVYFLDTGTVSNCNFTDNSATLRGGAIFSRKWSTTADTCIFKRNSGDNVNTVIYPPTLNVNNFTTVYGSGEKLTFDLKTNSSIPVTNGNISISVYFKDNNSWVGNYSCLSGEGWIPDLPVGSYIAVFNTEYAEFQKINRTIRIIPNIKFYANVTSAETNNRTVNITAKSNIPQDILEGKLLFILPNGTQIEATYGANGIWWAEHTFDAYGEYKVNATYVGLDNVAINNGTITINKVNSTITLDDIVLDYGETKNVTVTTTGATGITAKIGESEANVDGFVISIPLLDAGNYTLTVTTIPDDDHNPVTKEVNITVNKVNATLTVNDVELDYGETKNVTVTAEGATGIVAKIDENEANVNGFVISIPALEAGTYTLTVTAIADNNHNNVTKNATIIVNKLKTELTGSAITTTYNINKDLVITLKDITGKALSGVKVTVDLNGAKTYTTDKNGQVKVSTKGLAPKAYTAKVTFNGDTNYDKSTKDIKVTVKKATPKLTAKKKTFKTTPKTKKYTIVLKDNTGKAIKKAKVTLKVKGKTYKATTNSKGKATFKITKLNKKGTFKATVTYKGNKYFNKVSKKAKIKVIVTFKTVSKGSKDKATVKEIQQALKDKGYYLTYQGHYLKVDGKFSSCTFRSVKEFQHDKGLKVTGKVDEKTAKKLGLI